MRALNLTAPRSARLVDVADPQPRPGEVLITVDACGVCGSDLNAWRGVPGIEYPLPAGAPGHEVRGTVSQLGPGVQTLTPGDRVTGLAWNGLAESVVARADDLVRLPPGLGDILGEPLACAMNVVRRARVEPTARVAVVGFGYLAALCVQLFPDTVQHWIAVSQRAESRHLARRLGASEAFDFDSVPGNAWETFDVVIEAAGVQRALDYASWLVAFNGRLVVAGYHADGPRTVNLQTWNWKGIDVINAHERRPAVLVDALQAAVRLADERDLHLDDLHTHRLSLDEAVDAFRLAEERPTGFVKALICP